MDDPGYLIALAFSNCHRRHYIARAQGLCAYLCSSHRSYIHGFSSKCRVLCINTQIFLFFSSRYFFFFCCCHCFCSHSLDWIIIWHAMSLMSGTYVHARCCTFRWILTTYEYIVCVSDCIMPVCGSFLILLCMQTKCVANSIHCYYSFWAMNTVCRSN